MSGRQSLLGTVVLFVLVVPIGQADEPGVLEAPRGPFLADYWNFKNPQFYDDAEKYLEEHAEASDAPRVALEAYMLATVEKRSDIVHSAREYLIFRAPKSFEVQFCLTQFADAKGFRDFLAESINLEVMADEERAARRIAAAHLGLQHFGKEALNDRDLALKLALIAREAGDYRLEAPLVESLLDDEGNAADVAKPLFRSRATTAERLTSIAALDTSLARFARSYLFTKLSPEERRSPETLTIAMRDLLKENEFDQLLAAADELLAIKPNDCRAAYCRCWAFATTDRAADAITAGHELATRFPNDRWAQAAHALATSLEAMDRTIETCRATAKPLWEEARPVLASEVVFHYGAPEAPWLSVYTSILYREKRLETVGHLRDDLVFAIQSSPEGAKFYSVDDNVIYKTTDATAWVVPEFRVTDEMRFLGQFRLWSTPQTPLDALSKSGGQFIAQVTDSNYWPTLLESMQAQGIVAMPPTNVGTRTVMRFMRPSWDHPDEHEEYLALTRSENELDVTYEQNGTLVKVRLGYAPGYRFSPPKWDDHPLHACDELPKDKVARSVMNWITSFYGVMAETVKSGAETAVTESKEQR